MTTLNTIERMCQIERSRVATVRHGNEVGPWKGLCQSNARTAAGAPAWAPSALKAAQITESHGQMHPVKDFADIPMGAFIYFDFGAPKGPGHVMVAGKTHAFSNDYFRPGFIDVVPRDIPHWGGARHVIGWSLWTPFGVMRHR